MIDTLQKTRDFLAADAGLTALTGARLYAGRYVPPPEYTPADGAAVAFTVRGGQVTYDDDHLEPSVQFKCYAATEITAYAVYGALHDALQNGRGSWLRWARAETLGQPLREPTTDWPYVLTYYRLAIRAQ